MNHLVRLQYPENGLPDFAGYYAPRILMNKSIRLLYGYMGYTTIRRIKNFKF